MKRVGAFLLAKNINAAIVALLFALLPLLRIPGGGFVAAVIVAFVTLQKSYKDGLFVLAFVAIPALGMLFLREVNVFDVLLVRCVLVWWFAGLLAKHRSWRLVLEVGVILGFIVVVGLHVLMDMHAFWAGVLNAFMEQLAAYKASSAQLDAYIKQLTPIATGIMGFVVLAGAIVQLVLARWWQSALFNPGGLSKEFVQIRMSKTVAIIFFVILIGMLFKLKILIDFFPIMLLPFMIAGLSLLHAIKKRVPLMLFGLILVYVALFYLPVTPIVVMLLAAIGYVDSWYDIRERFQLLKSNYQK